MAYATAQDVADGFRVLSSDEIELAGHLLDEAAIIIDAFKASATDEKKKLVSCRMVRRQLGAGDGSYDVPIGATQGNASALGYSQSWTFGSGSAGEMYLSKIEKQILGHGNSIGTHSPLEDLGND